MNVLIAYSIRLQRPISLVDMILRLMIDDINLKIDAVVTFNAEDFADLCYAKGVELISN